MLFVLIIAIFVAFSYELPTPPARTADPSVALAGTLVAIGAVWLLAELFARITVRRLARNPDRPGPIMRQYQYLRFLHGAVLLGSYASIVHLLDWPAVVRRTWGLDRTILIDDLLVLGPFLASVVLSWLAQFRVEDCVRRRLSAETSTPQWWSRWSHLDFLLRYQLAIVLVPLLLFIGLDDAVELLLPDGALRQTVEAAVGLAGFSVMIVFAPLLLRVLWRAESMPVGPLRQRLEALSRRLGFRSSDILVWNTHGAVINAAVAGLLPWPRYVLVSDGLLRYLTEEEVEAVFGHEVAHIRYHHLWFYVAFLLGASLVLLLAVGTTAQLFAGHSGQPAVVRLAAIAHGLLVPLGCVAVYFGVFFGFLSRRFERQADIFGCRAVSCGRPECPPHEIASESLGVRTALCVTGIQTFVGALEKISTLNGSTRDMRSWRHFSIAKRVEFLERLAARPELERRFQRIVLLLKGLVVAGLVAATTWVWFQAPELFRHVLGVSR